MLSSERNTYYDARVRLRARAEYCVRPIVVTWRSSSDAVQRHETVELAQMQAEGVRHGVAAPFPQLMADLHECSMQVRVSPLDARFIQLIRVSEPVSAMLAGANGADSAASDQARIRTYTVTRVRYPRGEHHVLHYDPADPAKGATVFARRYTDEDLHEAVNICQSPPPAHCARQQTSAKGGGR